MSRLRRDMDTCFKDVYKYYRRNANGKFCDKLLSSDDHSTWCQIITMWRILLFDLHPNSTFQHQLALCDFASQDVTECGKALSSAIDLLHVFFNGEISDDCFKRSLSDISSIASISDIVDEFMRMEDGYVLLYRFLNFPIRGNLHIDLKTSCISDFIHRNEQRAAYTYPNDVCDELSYIILEFFADYSSDGYMPSHGPGVTSEVTGDRKSKYEKYLAFRMDHRLRFYLKENATDLPYDFPDGLQRIARLICVPKSLSKNRTISAEPSILQFLQQKEKKALYDFIDDRIPEIRIRDQRFNRELARLGSIVGEYSTIDLSSASDDVTTELVKRVFRRVPRLLRACITLRSDFIDCDGLIVKNQSFAPMGSAMCFPVECIIFWSILKLAQRRLGRQNTRAYVYGDDIVCHESVSQLVIELLGQLNFSVNASKTFFKSNVTSFRESCGGFYWNGRDITPFRISRRFRWLRKSSDNMTPEVSACLQDLHNTCTSYRYKNLRRYIFLLQKDVFGSRSFVFSTEHWLPFDDTPRNYARKHRWSDLHYTEYYSMVKTSFCYHIGEVDLDLYNILMLYEWFLYAHERKEDFPLPFDVKLLGTRTGLDWDYVSIRS